MLSGMKGRIGKLGVLDIGLIKCAVFFAALIMAKIFPVFLELDYSVLVALMALCAARPFYKFWFGK